jgi:glycosyltransferase involved in cell wall biosynthesis
MFPPLSPSGVVRSVAFCRHLPDFGWEPIVLTVAHSKNRWLPAGAQIPDVSIVRTRELDLHGLVDLFDGALNRLYRWAGTSTPYNYFREILCIPDSRIGWTTLPRGVALARHCDVIYVSCSPFSSALVGVLLKRLSGRPLVLDFRDAWSMNPHSNHIGFHRAIVRRLERLAVGNCDRLILNTPSAEAVYRKLYPQWADKMLTIPNGYNSLNVADSTNPNTFTIMHVGEFYGERTPEMLLDVLAEIGNPSIEFVQVGAASDLLQRYGDRVAVRMISRVPHEEAQRLMRSASLLYLKQAFERNVHYDIAIGAKTYEYLATGLPILAESPPGANVDLIREHAGRSFIVTTPDKEALKAAVLTAYEERGRVAPRVKENFATQFNRKRLTQQLADVFDELTAARS